MAEQDDDRLDNESEKQTDVDIDSGGQSKFKALFKKLLNFEKRTLIFIGIGTVVLIALIIGGILLFSGDDAADEAVAVEETTSDTEEAATEDDATTTEEAASDTTTGTELTDKTGSADTNEATDEQAVIEAGEEVPKDFEGDRLGAISESVRSSGIKSDSEDETVNLTTNVDNTTVEGSVTTEPETEMDELTRLRLENEELKKRLKNLQDDNIRMDYIIRTNNLLDTHTAVPKTKVEKPLDIQLDPKWGDFKDNKAKQ